MIKYLSNFILIIFLIYSLVLICIYIFQRKIIYHPFVNSYSQSQKEFTFKEVSIKTEDNLKLNAWFHEKDLKNEAARDDVINKTNRIKIENENIKGSISLQGGVIDDIIFKNKA